MCEFGRWLSGCVFSACLLVGLASPARADQSIARQWDDVMLSGIKRDRVRPPVQARNLFHMSVAMYDAWGAYDPTIRPYFFNEKIVSANIDAARRESISYAAYRILKSRFALSPNVTSIYATLDAKMAALGYSTAVTTTVGNSPAAVGNRIALQLMDIAYNDNSHEEIDHASYPGTYLDLNPALIVALPFNPTVLYPTRYQPLALSFFVDQNGNPVPGGYPAKVAPFWGFVTPFGLQPSDMDPARPGVLLAAPQPPVLNGIGNDTWRAGHEGVLHFSSMLTPDDGALIDISPASMGNNTLGTNDGVGRPLNPVTGQPYAPNVVKRGDWARCLAEFWADGPNSTTPPGHWNELASAVVENPLFVRRMGGKGPVLDPLEWDVKMYLALNGALHDAAITAWGIKGYYDTMRPIGAIRYLAQNGQCSDTALPSYNANGLHLAPGVVELITPATTAPGQRHQDLAGYEGKVAAVSWPGAPASPANTYSGVEWILAGNWTSYQRPTFVTPPFPGFVSGHSTYSRAGAEMLTRLTGSPYFPGGMATYTCNRNEFLVFEDGPSQTFTFQWATYYDAADNSGQSRIYGGIHPEFDDLPGRVLGSQVGAKAHAKAMSMFVPITPASCSADFNHDYHVDSQDLAALLGAWGSPKSQFDLTGDGQVNAADISAFLGAWGPCPVGQ